MRHALIWRKDWRRIAKAVGVRDCVELLGHDVRTKTKMLGGKEKGAKEKADITSKSEGFSKTEQEERGQEVVEDGHGSCKELARQSAGYPSVGTSEFPEEDGRCSQEGAYTVLVFAF